MPYTYRPMFTPQQFATLAAAALPAVAFAATICATSSAAGQVTTIYKAGYFSAEREQWGGSPYEYCGEGATIFEAVANAIGEAWACNDMRPQAYWAALATIQQAEEQASGASAACHFCQSPIDASSRCACFGPATVCPATPPAISRALASAHRRTVWVSFAYRTAGRRLGAVASILAGRVYHA